MWLEEGNDIVYFVLYNVLEVFKCLHACALKYLNGQIYYIYVHSQPPVEEEDSDSSSDEEPWNQPPQRGMGKQLPRPPPAA